MTVSIKMEPELRHVLAHMIYAVEALAKGELAEAQYEVESIKSAVFWDSEDGQTTDAKEWLARNEEKDDGEETEEMHEKEGEQDLQKLQEVQEKVKAVTGDPRWTETT